MNSPGRSSPQLRNAWWARSLIAQWAAGGVRHFALAPGSRSAPLALAVYQLREQLGITLHTHFDERGLGFFALGLARGCGGPVVVITTSGTAVANLHPAVIEARESGLPLWVVSADRPDHLLDCGANQAIQQRDLYGANVVASRNLCLPDCLEALESQLQDLAGVCGLATAGPVQFNCQFDEPLYEPSAFAACDFHQPHAVVELQKRESDASPLQPVRERLASGCQPVVVLGALSPREAEALRPWVETLTCPVIADINSQFRFDGPVGRIHCADLLLQTPAARYLDRCDCILQLGARLVSKRLLNWLSASSADYFLLTGSSRPLDPGKRARQITVPLEQVGGYLLAETGFGDSGQRYSDRTELISDDLYSADQQLDAYLTQRFSGQWHEAAIARHLIAQLPRNCALLCGNSLAVRMLDSFSPATGASPLVFSNRGASGIDGLLATAAGIAAGTGRRTLLLIGDTAFLHDLNSLALVAKSQVPVQVVVLNNHGGAIFNLLPAREQKGFEDLFVLPHRYHFEHACAQFGLEYQRVTSADEFNAALNRQSALAASGIVECEIDGMTGSDTVRQLLADLTRFPDSP